MNKFLIFMLFLINKINCQSPTPDVYTVNEISTIEQKLYWITNQTKFPLKLTIPIDETILNKSLNWDWLRLSDQKLVSKLSDSSKNYLVTETDSTASLYVLNYDNKTNQQLSSYEPKLVLEETNAEPIYLNNQEKRNIFTFAYLKKHSITSSKDNDKIQVSCIADFLISNDNKENLMSTMNLIEKNALFRLAFKTSGSFDKKTTEQMEIKPSHSDLFFIDKQQQQQQNSMHQSDQIYIQPQPIQPASIYQQPYQVYHQQAQSPAFYGPIFPPATPQEQINHIYEQLVNHPRVQEFVNYMNNIAYKYNPYNSFRSYPSYNLHQTPYGYVHPLISENIVYEHYFPLINRIKRTNSKIERQVNDIKGNEEDFDYDTTKFSKIRLTLGPLLLHRPFESEEMITCNLTLFNMNDKTQDFHSMISKTILTNDQTQNDAPTQKDLENDLNRLETKIEKNEEKLSNENVKKEKQKEEKKPEVMFYFGDSNHKFDLNKIKAQFSGSSKLSSNSSILMMILSLIILELLFSNY